MLGSRHAQTDCVNWRCFGPCKVKDCLAVVVWFAAVIVGVGVVGRSVPVVDCCFAVMVSIDFVALVESVERSEHSLGFHCSGLRSRIRKWKLNQQESPLLGNHHQVVPHN